MLRIRSDPTHPKCFAVILELKHALLVAFTATRIADIPNVAEIVHVCFDISNTVALRAATIAVEGEQRGTLSRMLGVERTDQIEYAAIGCDISPGG